MTARETTGAIFMTTQHTPAVDDSVTEAAYDFVSSMVPKADKIILGQAPMWYGWALRESYIAGAQASKQQRDELAAKLTDVELRCVKICDQRDELLTSMKAAANWIRNCSTPFDAAAEI